jgi:predicted secreted protein/Zn-dependent peptidase ImmA (M78 family)
MALADDLKKARIEGSLKAARELRRLRLDQNRAIDVFDVIVNANIWLLFQPLGNLLGAYLKKVNTGIIITTRRYLSVQRLTGAHEYGHHVLGHSSSVDEESDITGATDTRLLEEAAAQAFATDFLMPPALVNYLLNQLRMPSDLEPMHAYLLSLYMGTSYQATVHQLKSLGKINEAKVWEFTHKNPQEIKRRIGNGRGPKNSWAEIWPLDDTHNGQILSVNVDDELHLSLQELPSTGYLWVLDSKDIVDLRNQTAVPKPPRGSDVTQGSLFEDDLETTGRTELNVSLETHAAHLGWIRDEYETTDITTLRSGTGVSGNHYFTLRALRSGQADIKAGNVRPWQPGAPAAKSFSAQVHILDRPTGGADRGYLETAKRRDMVATDPALRQEA